MTIPLLAMAIILILIVICSLLLLLPFHLSFSIDLKGPHIVADYQVRWLGQTLKKGKMPPHITRDASEDERRPASEEDKATAKKEPLQEGLESVDPRSLIEALPALLRVFKDLIRCIEIDKFICHITFGLNDPADTAILSGYLWSLVSAVRLYNANISINPCFDEERLIADLVADLKARLLWIVVTLLLALREDKLRKLLGQMAKGAKGAKA
jgi:hypothetical protein